MTEEHKRHIEPKTSSMLPSQESQALSQAIYAIDNALGFLANWCPHGGDSTRIGEYYTAENARGLLEDTRRLLEVARAA